MVGQMSMFLGRDATRKRISKSIVYISIGSNDYIHFYLRNISGIRSLHPPWEFNRLLVDSISAELKHLYNANARKFVCIGMGPLGCAPRYLWESNSKDGECVKEINNMIIEYNFAMKFMVDNLSSQLPDAHITFCNIYDGIMDIVQNPQVYDSDLDSFTMPLLLTWRGSLYAKLWAHDILVALQHYFDWFWGIGHFLPEEDNKFLECVWAAVEEEERQAAADMRAATNAIANAERKSVGSVGADPCKEELSNANLRQAGEEDTMDERRLLSETGHGVKADGSPLDNRKYEPEGNRNVGYDALSSLPPEFYHCYHGSNADMGTLLEVRRTWDTFIMPGGS